MSNGSTLKFKLNVVKRAVGFCPHYHEEACTTVAKRMGQKRGSTRFEYT